MTAICSFNLTVGFLTELHEASVMFPLDPLPDIEFAIHLSDRPKLRVAKYLPANAPPLVLGYSKVGNRILKSMESLIVFNKILSWPHNYLASSLI